MANPEHLDWLREGVNRWNNRRSQNPFVPDLRSEDVSRALGGHERERYSRDFGQPEGSQPVWGKPQRFDSQGYGLARCGAYPSPHLTIK